ncbi:MAG: hypothetical protein ACKOT0_13820 [bacterium]
MSDTGVIAASLYEAGAVALIDKGGGVRQVALACSPRGVDIDPMGTTAWAVCQDSSSLHVIDIATAQVSVAPLGAPGADAVEYVPEGDSIVIASMAGEEIVVLRGITSGAYEDGGHIATPGERPSKLAVRPEGAIAFAVTDSGSLLRIDIAAGKAKTISRMVTSRQFVDVAVGPTGHLFAAIWDATDPAAVATSVQSINPGNGAKRSSVPLDMPGATTVDIAAGSRTLYVASGFGVMVGSENTGLFGVGIAANGRLGAVTSVGAPPVFGSAVGLSADASRRAFGTTNAQALGLLTDDLPYPAITLTARATARGVSASGTTAGMATGTRLTLYVKDLAKPGAGFVAQRVKAPVRGDGSFAWSGRTSAMSIEVYAQAPDGTRSATVRVVRRS